MLTAEEASREGLDLQLTAALGTKWAHAVNIRLVLESLSGTVFRSACQFQYFTELEQASLNKYKNLTERCAR
jgi:hypothetical protein